MHFSRSAWRHLNVSWFLSFSWQVDSLKVDHNKLSCCVISSMLITILLCRKMMSSFLNLSSKLWLVDCYFSFGNSHQWMQHQTSLNPWTIRDVGDDSEVRNWLIWWLFKAFGKVSWKCFGTCVQWADLDYTAVALAKNSGWYLEVCKGLYWQKGFSVPQELFVCGHKKVKRMKAYIQTHTDVIYLQYLWIDLDTCYVK